MAYALEAAEPLDVSIRRIATEELVSAIDNLSGTGADHDERIHDVRKSLKKLRALVRLVRSELGEATFARENECFRDLGRSLSHLRDAAASLESFDKLVEAQPSPPHFASIRERLEQRREHFDTQGTAPPPSLPTIEAALRAALLRVSGWPLERPTWGALEWGFRRTYRDGRRAHDVAIAEPAPDHFHDWRKRVKDHLYHLRLLADVWLDPMKARRDALDELADLLGDEHDLSVLRPLLIGELPGLPADDLTDALTAIEIRASDLRARAHFLGLRIYAERPAALTRRMQKYYDVWRAEALTPPRLPSRTETSAS